MKPTRALPALALLALPALPAAQAPVFQPEILATSGFPTAVNTHGQAVGWRSEVGILRAWVASEVGEELLPLPPGMASSRADDVNDLGVIVGRVSDGGLAEIGFPAVWTPSESGYEVQLLPVLPSGTFGAATAINNLGDIVGYTNTTGFGGGPATLFTAPGGPQSLVALGFAAAPADINDQRQLVGGRYRLDLDTGVVEDLGVPPSPPNYLWTTAAAINEAGQVASTAQLATAGNDPRQVARYTDGIGWEVLSPAGALNAPLGIDAAGNVLLQYGAGAALIQALYVDGVGLTPLEDLVDPAAGSWSIVSNLIAAMNEGGEAVTTGGTLGLGGVVRLSPSAAAAVPYGCAGPAGSLATVSPPVLGTTASLTLDDPLGALTPGAASLLAFSLAPQPAYPCGTAVPGWGLAGAAAAGELLVTAGTATLLPGSAWSGSPLTVPVPLPSSPALVGERVYAQGAFVDGAPGGVGIGLTSGLMLRLGS